MVEQMGQYRILRKLGEGGMGVVYAAHDERLKRDVALKVMRPDAGDGTRVRDRVWREARTAASVNHPHVCQVYEVGEEDGRLFIAMELLDGESLADRLARGPLPLGEAVRITLAVLEALDPLHRRGMVHRDLKPTNLFLTPRGVKLLDFGVARRFAEDPDDPESTRPGRVVGTAHYMAPEQLGDHGAGADARGDLFSLGVVLYEMLSGHRPFDGPTIVDVFHAIGHHEPAPLGGAPAVANVDRVLRRALAKAPDRRFASAEAMAAELREAVLLADSSGSAVHAQPLRRMIVLPFRILRPDAETDFLAFSLPDAITASLSGLDSLVVRSSLTAQRYAAPDAELQSIATGADVDIVLTGTLLRAGDQVRVTTQLADARSGALAWSQTSQVALGDLFQLQDALTRRIVESLAVPLSVSDRHALERDRPADPQAYEYYLRANQLSLKSSEWVVARDMYLQCLERDPDFAPAWARLGRIHRGLALYGGEQSDLLYERAQEAFGRALALSPDLPIAHQLYTNVEVDLGRSQEAMVRLLGLAGRHPTNPELFGGLVQACRYCGLLDASIAAWEHAVRLDRDLRTSVNHAFLMRGDFMRSVETNVEDPPMVSAMALDLAGRPEEAIELLRQVERLPGLPQLLRVWVEVIRLLIEDRIDEARPLLLKMAEGFTLRDPCAAYYFGRQLARAGETERALTMLEKAVHGGFQCFTFMTRDPWLESVRDEDRFRAVLRRSESRERQARAAFIEAGGEHVLGTRR